MKYDTQGIQQKRRALKIQSKARCREEKPSEGEGEAGLNEEVWRSVRGHDGAYLVSSLGRVQGLRGGRWRNQPTILRPKDNGRGYKSVSLYLNGKCKQEYVHRIVLKAFTDESTWMQDVNHIDGNKSNNMLSNLEWVNRKGNMQHAISTGLWTSKGIKNPMHKLSESDVVTIRNLYVPYSRGENSASKIAERFGVCTSTILYIIRRRLWPHVDGGGSYIRKKKMNIQDEQADLRKRGITIENKVERQPDGTNHSFYRIP